MKQFARTALAVSFFTFSAAFFPTAAAVEPILAPRDFPGWQSQNVCYPFVFRQDSGLYRMYYSGSGSEQWNDSNWDQWVSGYVTSTDNMATWKFPEDYEQVLFARRFLEGDLVDPAESAALFDSIFAVAPCILQDAGTFRLWYTGWNTQTIHRGQGLTDKVNFRIGYATSSDAITWTKVPGAAGGGSVLGLGAADDPDSKGAAFSYVVKDGENYRMWYEGYDGTTRRILQAVSPDGVTWTKQGLALDIGGPGEMDEGGAGVPMVIRRNEKYELWYQGQGKSSPNYHIMRATSKDGVTWTRLPGEISLRPASPVTGSESIHVRSAFVRPDGSVQVFYAKQLTVPKSIGYYVGNSRPESFRTETIGQNRRYHIYTEMVNPVP